MPASTRPKTKPPPRPRASGAYASPIAPQEPGAQTRAEKALVPQRAEMAHRLRGPISVVKRRHGLNRSRYRGEADMKRWVGLGAIADNLVNICRAMANQPGR